MIEVTFYFLLGLIIGSFLNVLVLRLNTGRTIVSGRSQCFKCNATLSWTELIPVFSYVMQLGKCRSCSSTISSQYPIVEALTGTIFAIVALKGFGLIETVFYLVVSSILIAIAVYDFKHKIIPDQFVFTFILLSLIFNIWKFYPESTNYFLSFDFLAGPIFFAFFALLWIVSRGNWMGFGDAKLVLGAGLMLGIEMGTSAMLLAFWSGAVVGILLLFISRLSFTMKNELPFAPFIILGIFVSFLFEWQAWRLFLL